MLVSPSRRSDSSTSASGSAISVPACAA